MSLREKIGNWTRFQHIIGVLAKHGFATLITEFGWQPPRAFAHTKEETPQQLRLAFEELGPSFIKLGQVLSLRPDIFPETYINEFSKLTAQVPAFPYSDVLNILERELGQPPFEVFETIDKEPFAAASISQVHRACLKETGEKVVLKVQRPEILKIIESDIQVLYFIAKTAETVREDFRLFNPVAIIKEFQRCIYEELDFTLEGKNIDHFRQNFPKLETIVLPQVVWSYTTSRLLTMTEVEGIPLSQVNTYPENIDRAGLAESLVTFFLESMFFHGLFHADAHPGNVLLQTEDRGRLGLIDFGMVGTLSPQLRRKLSQLFIAIVSKDFENLAVIYTEIGEFRKKFSIREFQQDISALLSPHLGKPLKQVNIGQLLLDSTRVVRRFQVRLPRDLVMFYRSLMTLEHIGRKLDPDFDFITYGQKFARTLVKRRFSYEELARDFLKTVEGFRALGTELPAYLKTIVRAIDNGDFSPSTRGSETSEFFRHQRLILVAFLGSNTLLASLVTTALHVSGWLQGTLWLISGVLLISFIVLLFRNR